MSWNQGNGDGPWKGSSGNQNPWNNRGGSNDGPDIDAFIRSCQEKLNRLLPNGGKGPAGIILPIFLIALIFLTFQGIAQGTFLGFYRVNDGETAVVQRFGAVVREEQPGLRWLIPLMEKYTAVSTTKALTLQMSSSTHRSGDNTTNRMVTRDLNLIEMDYTIQWRVRDPEKFLFKLRDPEGTLLLAAESVVREYIGRSTFDDIIPPEQNDILNPVTVRADGTTATDTSSTASLTQQPPAAQVTVSLKSSMQERLQKLLDEYDSGIYITDLQLTRPVVPAPVKNAYDGVQQAGNEAKSNINRAVVDANAILADARGEADSIRLKAAAYKTQVIESARGEADRFTSVLNAYRGAEKTTTARLYLETMEEVLAPAHKMIVENKQGSVLPYLSLGALTPSPPLQNKSTSALTSKPLAGGQ